MKQIITLMGNKGSSVNKVKTLCSTELQVQFINCFQPVILHMDVWQGYLPYVSPKQTLYNFSTVFVWLAVTFVHVGWVPCHDGMARPQVAD